MLDLFPVEKADYYEIDFYIGKQVIRTEKYKFIEDVKEALTIPLELYNASLAIPYTVYVEGDSITRFPFNPHEL